MSVREAESKQLNVVKSGLSDEVNLEASRRLTFDDEGRGGSPEVITVYVKARDLAQTLGHSTIEIPHLLLAFTLTADGINRLTEAKIDVSVVRRNCWMALGVNPTQPDGRNPVTFSTDLRAINAIASTLARKNDSIARMVQMNQVLEALRDPKFTDTVTPLMTASRNAPTPEEIRLNVEAIKYFLEERIPHIEQKTTQVSSRLLDVFDELSISPADNVGGRPRIRSIITALNSAFHEKSVKTEKG